MDAGRAGRGARCAVLAAALSLVVTGCSGDSWTGEEAAPTSSAEATSSSAGETSAGTTTTAPETSEGEDEGGDEGEDTDGPLDPEDEGRRLTLADFHMPSGVWDEERYDIADERDVQGIAAEVFTCGDSSPLELELRLANNFDELSFSVAQANDSQESDQQLGVEVLANNEQVEIRSVPFNQVQDFTIDVAGVNALKILLYLDDDVDGCSPSVIGVLTDITVD